MTTENSRDTAELEVFRTRLEQKRGRQFWRSLDELANTPEFQSWVEREFPQGAAELADPDPMTRRNFFKVMGASLALAGLSGCGLRHVQPQNIAPYTRAPESQVPGIARYYASTVSLGGYGSGVLVKSHENRPTKIEGNPQHPASLGATDIFAQAQILTMYDPDRSQVILEQGNPSTWEAFVATFSNTLQAQAANQGAGLRLLTETVTSPTMVSQVSAILERFPEARWYQYEPINRSNVHLGAQQAFDQVVDPIYDFSQANVVVSLDADFLSPGAGFIPYARAFAAGRKVNKDNLEMNRLFVVESTTTSTGASADHRLSLQARLMESFAYALAARLGVGPGAADLQLTERQQQFLDVLVAELEANRGNCLVITGEQHSPNLQALVFALNEALGNFGATVSFIEPVEARPGNHVQDIINLTSEMNAGIVDTLLIIGGNPVYTAPSDLRFGERLENVAFTAHLSLYNNETSLLCDWHINAAHFLESWSDVRAFDGTASIVQPLIDPLYGGKTPHDLLALLTGGPIQTSYDIVREYWRANELAEDFDRNWQLALSRGVITGTASQPVEVSVGEVPSATPPDTAGYELIFRPDPSIWDGFFANNGWLQETPKSISKLTWDNAALIAPRTAIELFGLDIPSPNNPSTEDLEAINALNGRMLDMAFQGGSVRAPIWIYPGQPENSITVNLGYGRRQAGVVGDAIGFDAYALRTTNAQWFGSGLTVTPTNETYQLVSTQVHWTIENRESAIYRIGTLDEIRDDPKAIAKRYYTESYGADVAEDGSPDYLSLMPQPFPDADLEAPNRWGMTINLNACIGCNACAVACQAENNIPVVGKHEVAMSREMNWIRIDRYFAGEDLDNPSIYLQPLPCMQCEQAPCEIVCPVNATVHDNEGINNMIYNRCVGTKYCSNNCPYKVRRFNFFQYSDLDVTQYKLMRNPEVSVRNRGVMEKCSYCVQRISEARIRAKVAAVQSGDSDNVVIEDGAIVTACEAACPTEAITFGDIADENSRVSKWRNDYLNYGMLGFLNTFPRTTYITRVRNPNNELEEGEA